jgi:hypothetical protein
LAQYFKKFGLLSSTLEPGLIETKPVIVSYVIEVKVKMVIKPFVKQVRIETTFHEPDEVIGKLSLLFCIIKLGIGKHISRE